MPLLDSIRCKHSASVKQGSLSYSKEEVALAKLVPSSNMFQPGQGHHSQQSRWTDGDRKAAPLWLDSAGPAKLKQDIHWGIQLDIGKLIGLHLGCNSQLCSTDVSFDSQPRSEVQLAWRSACAHFTHITESPN